MALIDRVCERGVTRRTIGTGLAAAGLTSLAGAARAQNADGVGHYVPYNCMFRMNVGVSPGGGLVQYTCKPTSDLSLITILLNLEYLEATFYMYAATGGGLSAGDKGGGPGSVSGGRKVAFSNPVVAAYAAELAVEERQHVAFLRSLIISTGVVPASLPNIALDTGFDYIMQQAGIVTKGQSFDAFANDRNFLLGAYVFEDLLVSACRGVIPILRNAAFVDPLGGLLATEGYHAGILRTILFGGGFADATNAISYIRSTLDGSAGTPTQGNDHGVGTVARATILDGDGNAIATSRSQFQVMKIVYDEFEDANPTLGFPRYFFPSGLSSPT